MPTNAPKDRGPLLLLLVAALLFAMIFGFLPTRFTSRPQRFQSTAKALITPIPPGGLNSNIQARTLNSMSDIELRPHNNVIDIIAFAATPEDAQTKAHTAMTNFLRAMQETYGPTNRVAIISLPEKGRPTGLFNR